MFTHFNPDHFEIRLSASILNAGDAARLQEQTIVPTTKKISYVIGECVC